MTYRCWIDDDAGKPEVEAWRSPPSDETDWVIARSTAEAVQITIARGVASFYEFDHDLGEDPESGETDTVMNFLSWLFQMFPNAIDEVKDWNTHSMNPNGADNINAFMRSWRRSRYLK